MTPSPDAARVASELLADVAHCWVSKEPEGFRESLIAALSQQGGEPSPGGQRGGEMSHTPGSCTAEQVSGAGWQVAIRIAHAIIDAYEECPQHAGWLTLATVVTSLSGSQGHNSMTGDDYKSVEQFKIDAQARRRARRL